MDDSHEAEVKGAKLHRDLRLALYGFDGLFHGALSEGLEFINNDGLGKVGKGIKDLPNKLNLKRAKWEKRHKIVLKASRAPHWLFCWKLNKNY